MPTPDISAASAPPVAEDVDWSAAWREHLEQSGLEANLSRVGLSQEDFWERFGTWMRELKKSGHPSTLFDRVGEGIGLNDTVLDIGAGAGTFSLPLCERSRQVTAVEPSPVQASRLEQGMRKRGITNLRIVRARWEDTDPAGIGRHDVVLAVHCFQMPDIRMALGRMLEAADRVAILVHAFEHDLTATLQSLGVKVGPNYLYLYRTLLQMGATPRVELLTRTFRVPLERQLDIFRCNPGLDEERCERLVQRLDSEGRLFSVEGEPYIARWHTDAVMHVDSDASERRDR